MPSERFEHVRDLYALLPIVGVFLIFWLLVIRPASRRAREVRRVQSTLSVGDEVITNAGIFGTIASVEDDRIGLQIADGVVVKIARPAIVGVTPRTTDVPESATADDTVNGQE
jgi:preprotein translocase subunit YajC